MAGWLSDQPAIETGLHMKKGILIVSFGTTHQETKIKNIERVVGAVAEYYPDYPIYQAYSSSIVRNILKKRDKLIIPDTKEALLAMQRDGITQVAVLPTHIIDGIENNRMKQAIDDCRGMFRSIAIADVLLAREEDYKMIVRDLWCEIKEEIDGASVIFMGHGSAHEADQSYEKLEAEFRGYTKEEIYLATVEGKVTIEDVIMRLKSSTKIDNRIVLLPFMLVAGDHAIHDMAGEEDSFTAKLKAEGYKVRCILKGLGEYESIRRIYIEHLRKVMEL